MEQLEAANLLIFYLIFLERHLLRFADDYQSTHPISFPILFA